MRSIENFREAITDLRTNHPHYRKIVAKLCKSDNEIVINFIRMNHTLSHEEFEKKANRLFMDKTDKPKNEGIITEVLLVLNSRTA